MSYYTGVVLADSPLALYPLAGNGNDLSGNGRNGTAHGGVTFGQASLLTKDPAGSAALFDGSSGYISLPTAGLPTGAHAWTLETWMSFTSAPSTNPGALVGMGNWGTSAQAAVLGMRTTNTADLTDFGTDVISPSALATSTPHHVVGTYDGVTLRLFVDSVLVASHAATINLVQNAASIGRAGSGNYEPATIQHVAPYNYALSQSQITAHYLAGSQGPQNYATLIAGKLVSAKAGTLNVQNQIGQRSTGALQVKSALGTYWLYGTQIQVFNASGGLAYAGYISKDKASKAPGSRQGTGWLDHNLTLMDNCYRADKRRAFGAYLQARAGTIVTDQLNKILVAEGVTSLPGSIAAGALIPQAVYTYNKSVAEVLTFLAQQSGFWWNIDTAGVLWFQPYAGVPAPFTLDGTTVDAMQNLGVDYGNDIYNNTQYVKGSYAEKGSNASPLVETLIGDGHTRSFTLAYQISRLRTVVLNGTDITSQMGTKGSTGNPFYYQTGDPVIAQDPSQTLLTSSDSLVVTYIGRTPIIAKAANAALVAAQKVREGTGTGLIEAEYSYTKVRTQQAAFAIASALLARYGQDMTVLTFDALATKAAGLLEGQMLTVNLSDFGLSNKQMLVTVVAIDDQVDGINVWYHVTAVGSPYDAAQWQTYFQNLMNQSSDPSDLSDVQEGSALALLLGGAVNMTVGITGSITKTTCFICGNATLCGNSTIVC